ncbi:MAG: twin-arginine translocase TatA/TatE family subunit [Longimicrobiales bacterium]
MGIGGLGMGEMILIFLVVLLLFGAKRLPEIGSSLGKGIREFKSSVRDIEREINVPDDSTGSISSTTPANGDDDGDGEPRSLTSSS